MFPLDDVIMVLPILSPKLQLLSHPGIPGKNMFLYRFVRRRRRPPILVHVITLEQLFGFLSFLARLLALTCRLPDYILVDFRRDLDLEFSRSNMEFAISQPKMVRLPRNKKQAYRLNSMTQMWPSGIGRTSRQPNYPNQLAPKWGSERSFEIGPQSHLVSLSGNLPIVQVRDTLSRRSYQPIVLAKPLMAPLISCS